MKKFFKSILAVSLCFIMLMSTVSIGISASAATVSSGTCGENLTWTLDDEGTLTISGTGDMYGYIDPDYYAPWYKLKSNIKTVKITDNVTRIGQQAFVYCSSLTSITIPDSVTSIGVGAFANCNKLVVFCNKDSYTHTYCKTNSIDYVLLDDDTERYITKGLGTKLTWSIDKLQRTLTISCNGVMSSFSKSDAAPWREYSKFFITATIEDGCTSIGSYAFYDCTSLASITIPDDVIIIGDRAFFDCTSLTNITIPDNVRRIGDRAFYNCTSLASITIPDSVKSIGEHAFYWCTSLTSITIPEGVTSIGDYAFWYCRSLKSITIPEGVTSIGSGVFNQCSSLTSITIPDSVTSIGGSAFAYCSSLTSITIPEGVTSIGSSVFYGCTSLTEIELPYSVKSIYSSTFSNCSALDKIYIYNRNCSISNTSAIPYNATIYGFTGSTAETFADENGYYFVAIDDIHEHTFNDDDICKLCGYDNRHEHNWSEWTVTIENNCTEDGEKYRTCSICSQKETEVIEATGHSEAEAVKENETKATCTEDGSYDEVVYCLTCSVELSRDNNIVPAIGHTNSKAVKENETKATCTEEGGYDTVVYCSTCTAEISRNHTVDPALGHTYSKAVKENETKATCTESGSYESVVYCATCNAELNRKVMTIPPAGHTAGNVVKQNLIPSTCVSHGKYDRVTYCSVCNLEMDRTVVNIAFSDHSYAAYTTNNDATCTKDGTKTAICTVCEAKNTITDKGSKLPHTDANKDGYCDVCKAVTNADLANPCKNAKINVAKAKIVDYKSIVTIKASATDVPSNYYLAIYVNGKQVAKGSNTEVTYEAGQITSDINYTVKVIDANGNVQKDVSGKDLAKDSKVTVNSSFFAKIIAFFKGLFGMLPTVTIKP